MNPLAYAANIIRLLIRSADRPSFDLKGNEDVLIETNVDTSGRPFVRASGNKGLTMRGNVTERSPVWMLPLLLAICLIAAVAVLVWLLTA